MLFRSDHWIAPWQDIPANIGLLQRLRCYVPIGDVEVRPHEAALAYCSLADLKRFAVDLA